MKRSASMALALFLRGLATASAQSPDAVQIDPTHHQVILENDHVRVIEARASAGARSPMHSHPPLVIVGLDRARGRMQGPDGAASILDLSPGQVLWSGNSFEHRWELLAGELHVIGVEIKAARTGKPPATAALPANDAVTVDPDHHQVMLENEWVRVFSALASPGAKSPQHSHPPIVVISLGRGRLRMGTPDGSSTIFDLHPGRVLWFENVVHSWELLSGEVNVIAVEVKSAR